MDRSRRRHSLVSMLSIVVVMYITTNLSIYAFYLIISSKGSQKTSPPRILLWTYYACELEKPSELDFPTTLPGPDKEECRRGR